MRRLKLPTTNSEAMPPEFKPSELPSNNSLKTSNHQDSTKESFYATPKLPPFTSSAIASATPTFTSNTNTPRNFSKEEENNLRKEEEKKT